ncbi:MAG: restriction endonuclease subunit S, partial [Planctomycetia bacterium]|nr:restriction endonuclease subunit S [Planctomycetia bacterium]
LTARRKQYEYYRDYLLDFRQNGGGGENSESCYGVRRVTLGEIATFTYGYTDSAKDEGETRFIRITDILDSGALNPVNPKYVSLTEESRKYLLKTGDILMARTGATYGKTLYIPDDTPAIYASFLIKINLNNDVILNRYYWHFAQSNLYWDQANKLASTGGQPQFNTAAVKQITLPLPSLSVQSRIVDVLDNFDAVCNDLQIGLPAEINARRKQYEYYRDLLLNFGTIEENSKQASKQALSRNDIRLLLYVFGLRAVTYVICPDGVEYRKLGELGVFYGGLSGKSKDDFINGNAKFITYKNVFFNPELNLDVDEYVKIAEGEKQNTLEYGDIVFTGSSETPDECGFSSVITQHTQEKLYLNSFCFFFRFNDVNLINPHFAKHLFRSFELRRQISRTASGVTRFNVSKKKMENVTIPIPLLEIQSEIASLLDRFDALCNNLTSGLPAEIAARQKQYEYYRDRLLSFSPKE